METAQEVQREMGAQMDLNSKSQLCQFSAVGLWVMHSASKPQIPHL